jgi:hypothetical protein
MKINQVTAHGVRGIYLLHGQREQRKDYEEESVKYFSHKVSVTQNTMLLTFQKDSLK